MKTLSIKRQILLLLFSLFNLQVFSQTILLQEDFSSASGTTPPTGWTVQTSTGDPLVDVWHFDNPGRRTPGAPIAGNFACFDSDRYSNNGLVENVSLVSPVFDATTPDNIFLEFDQFFCGGYGGSCAVEVYDGATWSSIYTTSSTTNNPQHSTFDITAIVQNISNAQIRFKWTGNYSWYWIVDNIKIFTQPVITDLFTEQTTVSLINGSDSSSDWGDFDNDGNLDVIIIGSNGEGYFSKIFRNNGDNSFSEQTGFTLHGVNQGSVKWGDYDNDGDLDVILSGFDNSQYITKIYRNDTGIFTDINAGLPGIVHGSCVWGDYDNDGDLDILIAGYYNYWSPTWISRIYRNDSGVFTDINAGIAGIWHGSSAWGDYDNDGDLDILLTGLSDSYLRTTRIYRNDAGLFTNINASLTGVYYGYAAWGDFDNDGDLDILLTGNAGTSINITKI